MYVYDQICDSETRCKDNWKLFPYFAAIFWMSNLQSLANYIYNNEAYNWKGCHVALCESLRDRVHNREFCVLLSIVCEAQESHKKRVNLFFQRCINRPCFTVAQEIWQVSTARFFLTLT